MNVREVCRILDELAPPLLAAEWDNTGLLVGDGKTGGGTVELWEELERWDGRG